MTERRARKILLAYAYQLRDRKPFEYEFTDMHEAILYILDLLDKKKEMNIRRKKLNSNLRKKVFTRIDYIRMLEKDVVAMQEKIKEINGILEE